MDKEISFLSNTPITFSPQPKLTADHLKLVMLESRELVGSVDKRGKVYVSKAIKAGEAVEFAASIKNTGTIMARRLNLTLKGIPKINDKRVWGDMIDKNVTTSIISGGEKELVVKIENITLSPGEVKTVSFSSTFEKTGMYEISIGDISKTVKVEADSS